MFGFGKKDQSQVHVGLTDRQKIDTITLIEGHVDLKSGPIMKCIDDSFLDVRASILAVESDQASVMKRVEALGEDLRIINQCFKALLLEQERRVSIQEDRITELIARLEGSHVKMCEVMEKHITFAEEAVRRAEA